MINEAWLVNNWLFFKGDGDAKLPNKYICFEANFPYMQIADMN